MKNLEAKKIAAAIAAVNLFIEEKQLNQKVLSSEEVQKKAGPEKFDSVRKEEMLKELRGASTNWAALGRMQSMNTRVLWQLKIFK